MFHDTTSFESNMKEDKRGPVPPLTVRKKDGSLYTRFPDVEAEIGEVWCLPPSDWVDRKEKLKSETLVCLICKAGSKDEYVRGLLLGEVNVRSARISESAIKGLEDVAKEEIALEVQAKIFDLVWSGVNCSQSEYLEIAFQALYLFHGEDKSLKEIAILFGTGTRQIRYRKDKAMHQIRVALGLETEEQREAFRKLRSARLAKRHAKSGAKPKVSIRPSSQPPSISI
jgi:hypothetical protein